MFLERTKKKATEVRHVVKIHPRVLVRKMRRNATAPKNEIDRNVAKGLTTAILEQSKADRKREKGLMHIGEKPKES